MTIDHVLPLAVHGETGIHAWLCRRCNSSKGTGDKCKLNHEGERK